MHNLEDEMNQIDRQVVESSDVMGKECLTCLRILAHKFFNKRSSNRDGRSDRCIECESAPAMTTAEHTARLKELNYKSEAVVSQRMPFQDDYRNDDARVGHPMHHSEFLFKLRKLLPCLYVTEGHVAGDWAVYRTYDSPQPHLDGKQFEYLWYIPSGMLPEYSQYEFDEVRNIRLREKQRGWRTPLLRLIKAGFMSEHIANAVFGYPSGEAATVWYRELWQHRNGSISEG